MRAKHANERNFPCEFCQKRFVSKCALKYHSKQHADPTKFYCNLCEHFYPNFKYVKHMERHAKNGKERRECTFCGKMFDDCYKLKTHMKIHSTEYKYPCDRCDRKFHQKKNLTTHQERRHFRRDGPTLLDL